MIEIKLEEESSLTLEMHIDGDVKKDAPQLRFSVLAEGMRYTFSSQQTDKGVYKIDFPKMLGKLTEGEYRAEVEIIVDGKHFVPLEETVKFTKEVKPVVKLAEAVAQVQEAAVKVTMGNVRVEKPKVVISDVRGFIGTLSEGEIDSEMGLRVLNSLALNESATVGEFKVSPKAALREAEAVAALRILRDKGTDIEARESFWEGIKNISPKTEQELRGVLAEKGLSSRVLKSFGF